ncbi:UNVERIFIED_ORG: putative membrane protein YqiK [Peribacillus simplex]
MDAIVSLLFGLIVVGPVVVVVVGVLMVVASWLGTEF